MRTTLKNGFEISEFTLGTVQLGMNYGINNKNGAPSKEEAFDILCTAESMGITSFDTAGTYGCSEDILGEYFEKREQKPSIVTKIHFDDVSPEKLFDTLAKKTETSCKRLKLEKLPFLMLHEERDLKIYGERLIKALSLLKNEGRVANLGISFSEKSEIKSLCDTSVFDCVQIPLNLFDSKEVSDGTIKYLSDKGVAVFARSIYLQGIFFVNPEELPTQLISAKEPLLEIRKVAESENMSINELALSFIRCAEGVTSVVLGCEKKMQVRENAANFNDKKLSASAYEKIADIAAKIDPLIIHPWEWWKTR